MRGRSAPPDDRHPWVTGELALGRLRAREEILRLLGHLPQATVATAPELLGVIERHELFGLGIGYVDAQLLAATMLTDDAKLWTRNRRLRDAAPPAQIGMPHSGNQRSSSTSNGSSTPTIALTCSSRSVSRCWSPSAGTNGYQAPRL